MTEDSRSQGAEGSEERPDDAPSGNRLLRLPLFYKILAANAVIVLVFSLLGTWLAVQLRDAASSGPAIAAVAVAGAVVSLAVNAVIIQLALEPLRLLKRTVDRVQRGDVDARVPSSSLADRDMERLTAATNSMLDRLGEYRARLRDVAASALNAAEEERRRISLELHDDASQRLAAILMRLRLARRIDNPTEKDAVLDEVRQELVETADGLRLYAQGLRPPALDELGLGAAIESHVRHVSGAAAALVKVETEGVGRLESPEAELVLYRIVQEAITNALRHASANEIEVTVARTEDVVVATVSDDGVGFNVGAVMADAGGESGLGLFGMSERAEYVGGQVAIRSAPGEGTTVRAAVPASGAGGRLPEHPFG